jgi:hypothetical protein
VGSPLADIVERSVKVTDHRPWPRAVVSRDDWILAALRLAEGKATLVSLWGDDSSAERGQVHMALRGEDDPTSRS